MLTNETLNMFYHNAHQYTYCIYLEPCPVQGLFPVKIRLQYTYIRGKSFLFWFKLLTCEFLLLMFCLKYDVCCFEGRI